MAWKCCSYVARICVMVGLVISTVVAAKELVPESSKLEPSPKLVRSGKRLYERRCLFCHGPHGEGNGPVSRGIFPKPRNFSANSTKKTVGKESTTSSKS